MSTENEILKDKYVEKSISYRGQVLHAISFMELSLNLYLAEYFCGYKNTNKILDMQLLIFGDDRMSLSNKAQVFNFIATKYDTDWFNAYKSIRPKPIKKPEYNLNQDLTFVIEQRNIFAHRILDDDLRNISETAGKGLVRFIRFKNEPEDIDYDDNKFGNLIKLINKLDHYIHDKIVVLRDLKPK